MTHEGVQDVDQNNKIAGPVAIDAETVRDWTQTMERLVERLDRTESIGRELVEQRALNLDLQRQVHRLETQLRTLRESMAAAAAAEAQPHRAGGSLLNKLLGKPGRAG